MRERKPIFSRLSGEKTRENHLGASLTGKCRDPNHDIVEGKRGGYFPTTSQSVSTNRLKDGDRVNVRVSPGDPTHSLMEDY
jgi:hypothetical protein